MTPKSPVSHMHTGLTNRMAHMFSDKQIHADVDTKGYFVIKGQVSENGAISMSC